MTVQLDEANRIVDEIFKIISDFGDRDYIGEAITQMEHCNQAGRLAELEVPDDDEAIIASFLHDLGHMCAPPGAPEMDGLGTLYHEKIGADYVRARGFPERTATLIESHVSAKRYLTHKYPDYYAKLSDASKGTLKFQGGPMSAEEADAYEKDALFNVNLMLRGWDDGAKRTDWHDCPAMEHFRPHMIRLLTRQN